MHGTGGGSAGTVAGKAAQQQPTAATAGGEAATRAAQERWNRKMADLAFNSKFLEEIKKVLVRRFPVIDASAAQWTLIPVVLRR